MPDLTDKIVLNGDAGRELAAAVRAAAASIDGEQPAVDLDKVVESLRTLAKILDPDWPPPPTFPERMLQAFLDHSNRHTTIESNAGAMVFALRLVAEEIDQVEIPAGWSDVAIAAAAHHHADVMARLEELTP